MNELASSKGINWYVLYTAPRAEKQVEQRLNKNGIEAWLPKHLSPRQWSDRIKMVEVPLFSSYVFVRTTDHILRSLVKQPGVSKIIFYEGKPATIKEKEIESIRLFLMEAKKKEISFSLDETVLIACGPLKNKSGKIIKVDKKHLVLHLEQIGITAIIDCNQVVVKK